MKITDQEYHIREITDVQKGTIPLSESTCMSRRSDAFVYIISGFAYYDFGKATVKVQAGDILFLSYHSRYDISVKTQDYLFIFIDFFFEAGNEVLLDNQIFHSAQLASLENVFLKVHTLWLRGSFSDKLYCTSLVYRIYSEIANAELHNYLPSATRKRIQIAMQTLLDTFSDPTLSVEKLSDICDLTPVHFRRIFYQINHTTPMKFLIALRIDKAKELLNSTQIPIAEIAEGCGFHSAYYFSKKFHENTGMTPSEYRKYSRSN